MPNRRQFLGAAAAVAGTVIAGRFTGLGAEDVIGSPNRPKDPNDTYLDMLDAMRVSGVPSQMNAALLQEKATYLEKQSRVIDIFTPARGSVLFEARSVKAKGEYAIVLSNTEGEIVGAGKAWGSKLTLAEIASAAAGQPTPPKKNSVSLTSAAWDPTL